MALRARTVTDARVPPPRVDAENGAPRLRFNVPSPASTTRAIIVQLTPLERYWLCVVFAAVYPSNAHTQLTLGSDDVPMQDFITDLFAHAPGRALLGLRAALWFVMLCPLFVIARPKVFSRLTLDERVEVLDRLGRNRFYVLREIPMLFKTIGGLGYAAMPAVQRQVGIPTDGHHDPSWVGEHGGAS